MEAPARGVLRRYIQRFGREDHLWSLSGAPMEAMAVPPLNARWPLPAVLFQEALSYCIRFPPREPWIHGGLPGRTAIEPWD